MPFPTTLDELRAAGYRFDNDAQCRRCPARIEWWITPAHRKIPLDVDEQGKVTPHFATCSPNPSPTADSSELLNN